MPSIAAILIVAFSASSLDASPIWRELGPAPIGTGGYTGRMSSVVCSPTDANKFYVGAADGGVWRTTDGGVTWTPLTSHMPTTSIGALAMAPSNQNIIYAGTGEANFANHSRYGLGIYRTADGGDTWTHLAESTFAGRSFSRIVVHPLNANTLYAAITHAGGFPARAAAREHPQQFGALGIFKSTDGGANWTHLTNGLPDLSATDMAIDPTNPNALYAAIGDIFGHVDNGIYKSTDAGASWAKLGGGLPASGFGRVSVAVAPSDPNRIYTIHVRPSTSTGGGASTLNVYKSTNGGASWTATNPGNFQASYGWYLSVVSVSPTNPDTVIVGGLSLLRSTNGGTSWSDITPPHVDLHAIAWDASGRLIVGDDGGVHRSANIGASWSSHNNGLGCIQFYAGLSLSPFDIDYVYGGTQDNGSNRRIDDNQTWTQFFGGDGGYTGVRPDNPNYVFCEFQGTGNLYRSTNYGAGASFSGSGISGGDRNCFLPPFTIRPDNDTQMLYGTHRVYYSGNSGSSWTARSGDLTTGSGAIRCLVVAPSDPDTVFVVTNDGNVQISQDFGFNWTLSRSGVPGWPRTTRQVAFDPTDDAKALLAVSAFGTDQILMTDDHGATWTSIDGDLPDLPVNTVAIEARGDRRIYYAGTDVGVYVSANGGANWLRFGAGMPNVPVIDLVIDGDNDRMLAGTQGRGAWMVSLEPFGDADTDDDVDLADFDAFADCFSASLTGTPPQPCLDAFDCNENGEVDAVDYAFFATFMLGPL